MQQDVRVQRGIMQKTFVSLHIMFLTWFGKENRAWNVNRSIVLILELLHWKKSLVIMNLKCPPFLLIPFYSGKLRPERETHYTHASYQLINTLNIF